MVGWGVRRGEWGRPYVALILNRRTTRLPPPRTPARPRTHPSPTLCRRLLCRRRRRRLFTSPRRLLLDKSRGLAGNRVVDRRQRRGHQDLSGNRDGHRDGNGRRRHLVPRRVLGQLLAQHQFGLGHVVGVGATVCGGAGGEELVGHCVVMMAPRGCWLLLWLWGAIGWDWVYVSIGGVVKWSLFGGGFWISSGPGALQLT